MDALCCFIYCYFCSMFDMTSRIGKVARRIGGALLALLGFSSCSKIIEGPVEYGTPNATYRISGTVKSKSGDAIGGVQVALKFVVPNTEERYLHKDTLYSDKSGAFSKEVRVFPVSTIEMTFNDIDGDMNGGEFESEKAVVTPVQSEKGSGSWYHGSFDVRHDAVLEKKAE